MGYIISGQDAKVSSHLDSLKLFNPQQICSCLDGFSLFSGEQLSTNFDHAPVVLPFSLSN